MSYLDLDLGKNGEIDHVTALLFFFTVTLKVTRDISISKIVTSCFSFHGCFVDKLERVRQICYGFIFQIYHGLPKRYHG